MNKDRQIIKILEKSCRLAISEILSVLSSTKDPLVKMIAIRRWENNYGMSPRLMKVGLEFKILGRVYRQNSKKKPQHHRSELGLTLTPQQKAEINYLHLQASIWVYKFWVSTVMAKIIVRGGGKKEVKEVAFNLLKHKYLHLKHGMAYRKLLKIFLESIP